MKHLLSIVLAMLVTIAWMWNPGHAPRFDQKDAGYQSFREELAGDAPKGVCYRVFVPSICRAVQEVVPGFARDALGRLAEAEPLTSMDLNRDLMPAYAAAGAVAFVSYSILGVLFGPVALLLAWAAIGPHGGVGDPVTVAAFAVAVYALSSGRLRWFWLAFVVASLNRETAPLMLVWWVLSGRPIRWAMVAFAGWAILRGALASAYAGNEMQMCWPMLERNLKQIAPLSAASLLSWVFALSLIASGLRRMPEWIGRGFMVGIVLLFAMAVLRSRPERLRVYLELLPIASAAIVVGLRHTFWANRAGS